MKAIIKHLKKVLSKEVSVLGVLKWLTFVLLPTIYVFFEHHFNLKPISVIIWALLTICLILLAIIYSILKEIHTEKSSILDAFFIKYNVQDEFNPNIKSRISLGVKNYANYAVHGVEVCLFDVTSEDENYRVMVNQVISNDINIIDGRFSINANSNKGYFVIGDLVHSTNSQPCIRIVTGNEVKLADNSLYNFNFIITGELSAPIRLSIPIRYIGNEILID